MTWLAALACCAALAALLPARAVARAPESGELVSVIVTLDRQSRAERVIASLDADEVGAVERFASLPAMVVDVAPAAIDGLEHQPGVVDVAPNRELRALGDESNHQMGADVAAAAGLAGAGAAIAVVDTGVDTAHPMLVGRVVGEACFTPSRPGGGGYCPNGSTDQVGPGAAAPCVGTIECGHGTHVAGTAAGDGDGHRGVAHDAAIIAVQVFTSAANPIEGVGTDEASVIRALDWIYTQRTVQPIAAVNLSLGGDPVATPCAGSAALLTVLGRLDAAGIAVVAASGNDGATTRLSFPACLPGVVSVGSVNKNGSVSSFSNSAASLTLLAPGQDVEGPWTSPFLYRTSDGTSFAAPHVSGAIAVLRAALPDWSVSAIVALLDRTGDVARRGTTGEVLRANAIRLDRAIQAQFQTRTPAALDPASSPIGNLDHVSVAAAGLFVSGWALDADTVVPTTVHVYVDGVLSAMVPAGESRPDVATVFPGWGLARGFGIVVPASNGPHIVCAYGIDVGPSANGNSLLGCRSSTRSGDSFGSLDTVTATFGAVRVAGWAIDPDTDAPIDVHVYVDRGGAPLRADLSRPDVADAIPGYGDRHGYDRLVAAPPGDHRVCTYAIDSNGGPNVTLGCRTVTVPQPSPFGALDVAARVDGGVEVAGWAVDPDTAASIDVHVYVDGILASTARADDERLDVAAVRPASGSSHGYRMVVPASSEHRTVCVYGINVAEGFNALIGCRSIS
jgi:subtilisin family serine protease